MSSGRAVEVARYSTGRRDLTGVDEGIGQRIALDASQVSHWLGIDAEDADRLINHATHTGQAIITADTLIPETVSEPTPFPTSRDEEPDQPIAGSDLTASYDEPVWLGGEGKGPAHVDDPAFISMAGWEAAEAFTQIAERNANLASGVAAHTDTTLTEALADVAREDALSARTALTLAAGIASRPGQPSPGTTSPQVNAAITTTLSATARSHDEVLTSLEFSAEHADILDGLERAQAKKTSRPHRRDDRYDYPAIHSLTDGPLIQQ